MCRASRYVFLTSLLTVLRTHPMTTAAAEEPSEFQNKGTSGYSRQFIDLQAFCYGLFRFTFVAPCEACYMHHLAHA